MSDLKWTPNDPDDIGSWHARRDGYDWWVGPGCGDSWQTFAYEVAPDGSVGEGPAIMGESGFPDADDAKARAEELAKHLTTARDAPRDDVRRALDSLGEEARDELCRYLVRKGHMGPELERLASLMASIELPDGAPSVPVGVVFERPAVIPRRPNGDQVGCDCPYQVHMVEAVGDDGWEEFDVHMPGMERRMNLRPDRHWAVGEYRPDLTVDLRNASGDELRSGIDYSQHDGSAGAPGWALAHYEMPGRSGGDGIDYSRPEVMARIHAYVRERQINALDDVNEEEEQ